jgi:uncharacterized membrane protein (Fun14 family)
MEPNLGKFTSNALRTISILIGVFAFLAFVAAFIGVVATSSDDSFTETDRASALAVMAISLSTLVTSFLLSAASVVIDLLRYARAELSEINKNTSVLNRI